MEREAENEGPFLWTSTDADKNHPQNLNQSLQCLKHTGP